MKLCNHLSSFRQLIKRRQDWIDNFTTNFIATVLGILLTFGTSMWYESRQKKQAAKALVERCLTNMETRLNNLDGVVSFYDKHEELLAKVQSNPLDSISDEILGDLIYQYTIQYNLIINHAYEKAYSQSVTSHEILGQYAEIIGEGFEYLLYTEQQHEEVNKLQAELLKGQILSRNTAWDKGSMKEVVSTVLNDPFFAYFNEQFSHHSQTVRHLHSFLQLYIPEARRLWNGEITEDEFRKETEERWNEWNN